MDDDKAQPDSEATKPIDSKLPIISAVLALSAAGLYFVGWQYKQSLAVNFGLASYPGDLSFQGTVATGIVAILDGPVVAYIAVFMSVVWIILQGLGKVPELLLAWLNVSRRERITNLRKLRNIRRRRSNNEKVNDDEVMKLENDVDRMIARHRRRKVMITTILRSVFPLIVVTLSSLMFIILSLFYVGHLVANSEAKEIRSQAMGNCQGCFVYDVKPFALIGIPLFQSADTIFIQTRNGVTRISVNKLNGIKSYGGASNAPSKIPRL